MLLERGGKGREREEKGEGIREKRRGGGGEGRGGKQGEERNRGGMFAILPCLLLFLASVVLCKLSVVALSWWFSFHGHSERTTE